jgi:hypothetical protein
MTVIDISYDVKNLPFDQKNILKKSYLNQIKIGLYVMVFENNSDVQVFDKNKMKDGSVGKVVVPENSVVIKTGKFENGLLNRLNDYYKHTHFKGHNESSAFIEILRSIKVFAMDDLKANYPSTRFAAVFEQYWNQSVFHKFNDAGALSKKQNKRSEYRLMNISHVECGTNLDIYLHDLANRIKESNSALFS